MKHLPSRLILICVVLIVIVFQIAEYRNREASKNGDEEATKAEILTEGNDKAFVEAREIDIVIEQFNTIEDPEEDNLSKQEILDYIEESVKKTKKIDISRCPEDFRIAYEHLVQAMEYFYVAYFGVPDGFWDTLFSGDEYKNKLQDATDRILKAEGEVNESAARHGAKKRLE